MEIFGRITSDAKITELKDGRKVVNFTVAHNDTYRPKGSSELKKIATFFKCALWRGAGVAPFLTKGTAVELSGRVGIQAWKGTDGEARASLSFFVNEIKLHGKKSTNCNSVDTMRETKDSVGDDLPF